MIDVIDHLAGLAPDSPLAHVRDRKPITRQQAQASYAALFEPADTSEVSLQERFALATFTAGLHGQLPIVEFYAASLPDMFKVSVAQEAEKARTTGPYGSYPKGPLSTEDLPGPTYHASDTLGTRLKAAFEHVHMLVFHPRDAEPEHLQRLLDAGWSNTGIVTLSQLVAFLSFQIRTIAGLRTLAGTPA
jgi:CMD domain protein